MEKEKGEGQTQRALALAAPRCERDDEGARRGWREVWDGRPRQGARPCLLREQSSGPSSTFRTPDTAAPNFGRDELEVVDIIQQYEVNIEHATLRDDVQLTARCRLELVVVESRIT